jgi:hypothetical protein
VVAASVKKNYLEINNQSNSYGITRLFLEYSNIFLFPVQAYSRKSSKNVNRIVNMRKIEIAFYRQDLGPVESKARKTEAKKISCYCPFKSESFPRIFFSGKNKPLIFQKNVLQCSTKSIILERFLEDLITK